MERALGSDEELVGVRGWLLLLVFVLVLISPILALLTGSEYGRLSRASTLALGPVAVWLFFSVRGLAYLSAGAALLLWKTRLSPRYAIFILWVFGPVSVWLWQHFAMRDVSLLPVAKACAPAVLWSAYLHVSRRVKRTYQ